MVQARRAVREYVQRLGRAAGLRAVVTAAQIVKAHSKLFCHRDELLRVQGFTVRGNGVACGAGFGECAEVRHVDPTPHVPGHNFGSGRFHYHRGPAWPRCPEACAAWPLRSRVPGRTYRRGSRWTWTYRGLESPVTEVCDISLEACVSECWRPDAHGTTQTAVGAD
jgi:hypothetical protein